MKRHCKGDRVVMRITKKDVILTVDEGKCKDFPELATLTKAYNKLSDDEDAESRLGIEFLLLEQAMNPNTPIYAIGNFRGVREFRGVKTMTEYREIIAHSSNEESDFVVCPFKDYGKTWSLTRQRMENITR